MEYCKTKISKNFIPETCPIPICKKRLGPQEILKYLDDEERVKFETSSLNNSCHKNMKRLMWCKTCRELYCTDCKGDLQCETCGIKGYGFHEAMKLAVKEGKLSSSNKHSSGNKQPHPYKLELHKQFLKDCKKVGERCFMCLKRSTRIKGYSYPL